MIKKLLIVFIILLLPNKTFAQDLIKTLSDAFENNSKLNAERASYKASRQDVNISKGEFLPSVTLSGDLASQENSKRTDQTGTKLADSSSSPETQSILIIGEIGGSSEEEAAEFIKHSKIKKPIVSFIAGITAPSGKRMGHAGAIVSAYGESAVEKVELLKECGVIISKNPSVMGETVKSTLNGKKN